MQVISLGIINTFLFALFGYHGFQVMLYFGFYFDVICCYLRIKMRKVNKNLLESPSTVTINLKNLSDNIREINEYNQTFWSKYFLQLWLFLGSLNMFMLYISLFSKMFLSFKMIYFYAFSVMMSFFLFVILNASSINSEAKNSFKILNSIYVSYYSRPQKSIRRKRLSLKALMTKFKVKLFSDFIIFYTLIIVLSS